jgi:type I restriction enzyme S subunit
MKQLSKYKKTEREIPKEWKIVKIQDICKTSSGGTPSRGNLNFFKGDIPWVKTGELKDGYIYHTEEHISEEALKTSSAKLFPPDTVLFAMYGATIGKTAITKIFATTNQACCAFLPLRKESVDPYFLQQYFIHNRPEIISKGEGAGQPNTSQDFLKVFEILYPPIKEQQKISSILSDVDDLIQKTDQIVEQTQKLKKGLIQRLLTKGIGHNKFRNESLALGFTSEDIPVEWNVVKLKQLCDVVRGGSPRPAGHPDYFGGNIPWITVGELTKDDSIYLESVEKGLTEEGKLRSRYLTKDTVVLANSGATLGVPKILKISGCINDGVAAFLNLKNSLLSLFLYFVLYSWIEIFRNTNQGMGQPNLNTTMIDNLKFPLPPLEEQKEIVRMLVVLNNYIQVKKENKLKLINLKKGLMQKLLTGKIRVKV